MLSLIHLTALSRVELPADQRKPCHVYCDEAHRFITDAIDDLISETRKYGVHLTRAHQFMNQFPRKKIDALANVGTTIIFNVDADDAGRLKKGLRGLANEEDIIALQKGEAIARIGTEVVRVETLKPLEIPPDNNRERIIRESRQRYYLPAALFRQARLSNALP